ncbi:MAG: MarR family transcriptional regulator [Vulcanimicrobiaceae bacterium]
MNGSRLDGLLGYHLRRAQLKAFAAFAREVAGLSPMLFGVLATIEAQPGIGQGEIADALGADRSTMVRLVDQLERRGLVRRESRPDDRRTVIPTLTPAGRTALAAANPQVLASEELFAGTLSAQERRTLADLLQRISAP